MAGATPSLPSSVPKPPAVSIVGGVLATVVVVAMGLAAALLVGDPRGVPLHSCTATLDLREDTVSVTSWGSTHAEAQEAAWTDGRILSELVYLAQVQEALMTEPVAELPYFDDLTRARPFPFAVEVGDCGHRKVPGDRFAVLWPGGERLIRDTPAAALSAARRRTCGLALRTGWNRLRDFSSAGSLLRDDFGDCWTAPEPVLEVLEDAQVETVFTVCRLPDDELRARAIGVGSTPDDAREAALRGRALAQVRVGHTMASQAAQSSAEARLGLVGMGFQKAVSFVVPVEAGEVAAADCRQQLEGAPIGRLAVGDEVSDEFDRRCTTRAVAWPSVDTLAELPAAIQGVCDVQRSERSRHLVTLMEGTTGERRAVLGHAGWGVLAKCEAMCRTAVVLPEAELESVR